MQSSGFALSHGHPFDDFRLEHDAVATGMTIWQLEEGVWDNNLEYYIHETENGLPTLELVTSEGNGELVNSYAAGDATNIVREPTGRTPPIGPEYKLTFDFASPVFLEGGETYWIGLHGKSADNNHSGGIFWTAVAPGSGSDPVRVGFSAGEPAWLPYYFDGQPFGLAFEIHGEVVPPFLQGDHNGNGLVEHGDLDLVLVNWGIDSTLGLLGWIGDPASGIVDQEELDRVLVNWGRIRPSAAAVPEPTSVVLLTAAALFGCFCRTSH